jgi:hypothetical protein
MDADIEQLERMVDRFGPACLIEMLQVVCNLKADHLRENWDDQRQAGNWDAFYRQLERTLSAAWKLPHP